MYIRFKDIPKNEISGVYDGDLGKIRDELGVSCYNTINIDGFYRIILPSISEAAVTDLWRFIAQIKEKEISAYLINGNEVGLGSTGEPVIKNINTLNKLKIVEIHSPKPKFKMDKSNIQFIIDE